MTIATTLVQFWSERAARERQILATGAVFLALLVLYLVLVEPAASAILQLQRSLPQTRAQAAQLEALVAEAKSLRSLPPVAAPGAADARSALDKSLESAGLKAARNAPLANGDLRLTFVNVPFGKWTTWLSATEHALGVHAVAVHVKASATAGNADIELSLRLPRA
ncbi:putative General secretion pathway protein M [Burkholderiales bacterium]|nr:putative General secretion pathway protein M [Burkholderiales bacterium]